MFLLSVKVILLVSRFNFHPERLNSTERVRFEYFGYPFFPGTLFLQLV